MPTVYNTPAFLRLQESSQSGEKTMTGVYVTMFEDYDKNPWVFTRGSVDLSNMASLDVILIKISVKTEEDGSYAVYDLITMKGEQPDDQKLIQLHVIPNVYGVKVEAYQSAGTNRVVAMKFFVAKR